PNYAQRKDGLNKMELLWTCETISLF
ncbi:MAG: hypothetical protein ACJAVK_000105, partial [Akkermansiaceae bacterium]